MGGELYLSTRYKSVSGLFKDGRMSRDQVRDFTGLSQSLLSHIPASVLSLEVSKKISLPDDAIVRVHERVLRAALPFVREDSAILECRVGDDFRALTPELTRFAELVPVMRQALDPSVARTAFSTHPSRRGGHITFAMDQDAVNRRGVTAWLDEIDHPDYQEQLGVLIDVKRFYGSIMDRVKVWLPLDITVEDQSTLD